MGFTLSALGAPVRLALVGALFALAARRGAQEQPAAHPAAVEAAGTPTVAAAASLRYALDEIAKRYEKETGKSVKITYGATGNLVHQIEAGAPFQALFAADDESVKKLAKAGKTDGEPVIFARGELSVAAPKGSPVAIDADLKGLKEALAAGKVKHVAIANPETAPYGRAAQRIAEEGRAVGAGAAAARHRREHRPDGDVRLDRRRRGRVSSPSRSPSPRRSRRRSTPPSSPGPGTSRSITAWR